MGEPVVLSLEFSGVLQNAIKLGCEWFAFDMPSKELHDKGLISSVIQRQGFGK